MMFTKFHINRIPCVDFAKGLAIIAVIVGHSKWSSEELVWFIYSWHMPLFFLLAGFTFRSKSFKEILSCSARRLLLPYFIICFLVGFRLAISGGIIVLWERFIASVWAIGGRHPWTMYCPNVAYVGAIWFLPAMFWCRVAFQWISQFRYKYVISFLIAIIATLIDANFFILPLCILEGLSALTFFALGHLANQYQKQLIEIRFWLIPIGLVCWWWQLTHPQISMVICRYVCYPVDVIGACFASWCVVEFSKYICRFAKVSKIILWVGVNSLAVLCMHNFESFCFDYSILNLPIDSFFLLLIRLGIIFSLVFILGCLPMARRLFGIRMSSEKIVS